MKVGGQPELGLTREVFGSTREVLQVQVSFWDVFGDENEGSNSQALKNEGSRAK